ncbi:hypothetical protein BDZ89DRAFT_1134954 [Hymenopellis radicata]|nr:hypothetical protein BDZ89DRAFT_1134954 [Hymenopellis radicata]
MSIHNFKVGQSQELVVSLSIVCGHQTVVVLAGLKPSDVRLPWTSNFFEKEDVLGFIHHWYCLFRYGPFNIDSLAYIFMAIRPVLKRKKMPPEAVLLEQLEKEYSAEYSKMARAQIYRREGGKEVYRRRLDEKEYELARIPAKKDVLVEVMYQLAESGRLSSGARLRF